MITGALKNQVDKLWLEFWQGGISNPLSVIEQITFLMFLRLFDIAETREEKKAARLNKPFKGHFGPDQQQLRWQNLMKLGGDALLKTRPRRGLPPHAGDRGHRLHLRPVHGRRPAPDPEAQPAGQGDGADREAPHRPRAT